jgi:GNAT superfamily N-acetyltransferase
VVRPLAFGDVPLRGGLLIQLGIERAEATHDDLAALTPAELEGWLQRPGTVAFAAWEIDDPTTPLGVAWASRRRDDGVLRFIGVLEDARRRGIGRTLLGAVARALAQGVPPSAGGAPHLPAHSFPVRARLNDAGHEQAFFRSTGFEAEQVTFSMARDL